MAITAKYARDLYSDMFKINCFGSKKPMAGESVAKPIRKATTAECFGIITGECNGIVVLDLDAYKWDNKDNHPWIKAFGANYIDSIDTFTVRSVRGGIHLYFEYTPELITCVGDTVKIDVRSDIGYIIGAGSKVNYIQNTERIKGVYTVVKASPIRAMSEEMKKWVIANIQNGKSGTDEKSDPLSPAFIYDIPVCDIWEIAQALLRADPEFFGKTKAWHDFTTFSAHIEGDKGKPAWDLFSQTCLGKYSKAGNEKIWERLKTQPNYAIYKILKLAGMKERLPYYQYKPFSDDKYARDIAQFADIPVIEAPKPFIINRRYLSLRKDKRLGDFDNVIDEFMNKHPSNNLLIKSGMNTGKTTSFAKYINTNTGLRFLSITSRSWLAMCQYEAFHGVIEDIDDLPNLYNLGTPINEGESLCIQLDSIGRLCNWDFSEYVVFLDEVASIFNYLITSETLGTSRCTILELFVRILKTCAQIVAVDADVDYGVIAGFKRAGIKYTYVINKFNAQQGIPAEEINTLAEVFEKCKLLDKWMIAMDSRKQAKALKARFKAIGILCKCITSDTGGFVNLDEHERVIFSPKVVYGIDSIMQREVFAVYTGRTLSPSHFVQQINRCRNIIKLSFCFLNKHAVSFKEKASAVWRVIRDGCIKNPRFDDVESAQNFCMVVGSSDLLGLKNYNDKTMMVLFNTLYPYYLYREDAESSNKFKHFILKLKQRGFDVKNQYMMSNKNENVKTSVVLAMDREKFDAKDLTEAQQRLAVIFNIDGMSWEIEKYSEYLIDENLRRNHFNITRMFLQDTAVIEDALSETCDFQLNIIKSDMAKVVFLKKFITVLFNGAIDEGIITLGTITPEIEQSYLRQMKASFRFRTSTQCIRQGDGYKFITLMAKELMGKDIIYTDKDKDDNKIYVFDKEIIDREAKLYFWRKPNAKPDERGYDDE